MAQDDFSSQLAGPAGGGAATAGRPGADGLAATVFLPLARLALPTMAVSLAQVGVAIAEIYYISFLGTAALAGATLVFPFYMLMSTMSGGGLGNGVSSAMARATGAGRGGDVDAILLHALLIALVIGAACSAAMLLGGGALYRGLSGRGAVLHAALAYSNILFAGVVSLWVTNLLAAAFRGMGNPLLPAKISLAGAAFVIPASPALIFGFGPIPPLGIAGAGLATILYQAGAMLALLWHVLKWRAARDTAPAALRPRILADIFRIGIPSSFNALQHSVMAAVMAGLAARFGIDALAAYGIAARLDSMLVPPLFGIATAVLTMVGMNVGAGDSARARRFAWAGAVAGALLAGVPGLVVAVRPELWLGLFSHDADVLREGASYLHISGFFYAAFAAAFILSFAVQGAGNALWASAAVMLRFAVTLGIAWSAVSVLDGGFAWLAVASGAGIAAYAATSIAGALSPSVWARGRG